jgi:hypothetical protein
VEGGDRFQRLCWLRDLLTAAVAGSESARDLAALSRQLTDVLAQIDEIAPAKPKGTPLDELEARRAARPASPSGRAYPAG